MDVGDNNRNGHVLVRKTERKSTTHWNQKIWIMRCGECRQQYGCNGCDAHIRSCPNCDPDAAPGEPLEH